MEEKKQKHPGPTLLEDVPRCAKLQPQRCAKQKIRVKELNLLAKNPQLVGGWTNPVEKHARQIGSWNPKVSGKK